MSNEFWRGTAMLVAITTTAKFQDPFGYRELSVDRSSFNTFLALDIYEPV